jgi:hypothetical protein
MHPGLGKALGSNPPLASQMNRTLLHMRWDTRSPVPEPRSVDRPAVGTSGDGRFILSPAPRTLGVHAVAATADRSAKVLRTRLLDRSTDPLFGAATGPARRGVWPAR